MKYVLSYEVECDNLSEVIKLIEEIDSEMGMIPKCITQSGLPIDIDQGKDE